MVEQKTIGKMQIILGISFLILGILILIYVFVFAYPSNGGGAIEAIGKSWVNTMEQAREINQTDTFLILSATMSTNATIEGYLIKKLQFISIFLFIILSVLSINLILQVMLNISK